MKMFYTLVAVLTLTSCDNAAPSTVLEQTPTVLEQRTDGFAMAVVSSTRTADQILSRIYDVDQTKTLGEVTFPIREGKVHLFINTGKVAWFSHVPNPMDIPDLTSLNGGVYHAWRSDNANPGASPYNKSGCDLVPDMLEGPCLSACCADHDECYHENRCTWTSWFSDQGGAACDDCNRATAACVMDILAGNCDCNDLTCGCDQVECYNPNCTPSSGCADDCDDFCDGKSF